MFESLLLLGAGLLGGMVNAIAGGGSFITFPALLLVGVPPVSANATNTFAACAGYMSGAYALRQELHSLKAELPRLLLLSLLGGIAGAWLLLQMPDAAFREAIPWLLLFATVLFIWGGDLSRLLQGIAQQHRHASRLAGVGLSILFFGVCLYGGFFNAGLGIVILSYLALAGYSNINAMNALKLLVSSAVSLIAIALFIYDGVIVWYEGSLVLVGTLAGGYIAAHLSRRVPQHWIRHAVSSASVLMTAYFFWEVYAA